MWIALQLAGCVPPFPEPAQRPATPTGSTSWTGATGATGETGLAPVDADGDGVAAPLDCDDADPSRYPGAVESCGDGVDRDCDGTSPACALEGEIPLDQAVALLGVGSRGAVLARAGGAVGGRPSVGLGTSGRGASNAAEGQDAWVMGWGVSSAVVHRIEFGLVDGRHTSVAGLGDLDGDGHDDLLAASYCYDGEGAIACLGNIDLSTAFLLRGPISGDVRLATPPPSALELGGSVRSCPGIAATGLGSGRWATSGGCADADTGRIWVVDGFPSSGSLDAAAVTIIEGALATDYSLGWTLASGDVIGGDGVVDLLSGTYGDDGAGMSALLFSGATLAQTTDIAQADARWRSSRDPDAWVAGTRIEAIGDVDGDGQGDVLVGMTGTWKLPGAVFLMAGGFATPSAQTVDQVAWATLEGASETGLGAAVSASDLDRDGLADLLLGAPGQDAVLLVPGSALALGGTFDAAEVATATFTGSPGSRLGVAVLAPGDLDGDGWDDVVVGALEDPDASAWVFQGGIR